MTTCYALLVTIPHHQPLMNHHSSHNMTFPVIVRELASSCFPYNVRCSRAKSHQKSLDFFVTHLRAAVKVHPMFTTVKDG